MKRERVLKIALLPVVGYGAAAVLSLWIFRMGYGHAASTPFSSFLMWSGVAAGFALLVGALIEAHLGFRRAAVKTALFAIGLILASGHLAPYLAR